MQPLLCSNAPTSAADRRQQEALTWLTHRVAGWGRASRGWVGGSDLALHRMPLVHLCVCAEAPESKPK